MGLDTTHDCWHGPYSSFAHWRKNLAHAVGIELDTMDGFGGAVPWSHTDPLETLLDHSDCDGEIAWEDAAPLADRLEELLPHLDWNPTFDYEFSDRGRAETFIKGLRIAASSRESVIFA